MFTYPLTTRWADMDPNRHVRHSVYADYCAQARVMFFQQAGFTMQRLGELGVGPILFREELKYLRELGLGEAITVTVELGWAEETGRKWQLVHQILKADGTKSAHVVVDGAWIDLLARRVIAPPPEVANLIAHLQPYLAPVQG